MPKLFEPSSTKLLGMIASAEAKFEHAREQARLKNDAAEADAMARAIEAEVKARYYFRIQHGREAR